MVTVDISRYIEVVVHVRHMKPPLEHICCTIWSAAVGSLKCRTSMGAYFQGEKSFSQSWLGDSHAYRESQSPSWCLGWDYRPIGHSLQMLTTTLTRAMTVFTDHQSSMCCTYQGIVVLRIADSCLLLWIAAWFQGLLFCNDDPQQRRWDMMRSSSAEFSVVFLHPDFFSALMAPHQLFRYKVGWVPGNFLG